MVVHLRARAVVLMSDWKESERERAEREVGVGEKVDRMGWEWSADEWGKARRGEEGRRCDRRRGEGRGVKARREERSGCEGG